MIYDDLMDLEILNAVPGLITATQWHIRPKKARESHPTILRRGIDLQVLKDWQAALTFFSPDECISRE